MATEKVVLSYEVDKASLKAAVDSASKIEETFEDLGETANETGQEIKKTYGLSAEEQKLFIERTEEAQRRQEELGEAIKKNREAREAALKEHGAQVKPVEEAPEFFGGNAPNVLPKERRRKADDSARQAKDELEDLSKTANETERDIRDAFSAGAKDAKTLTERIEAAKQAQRELNKEAKGYTGLAPKAQKEFSGLRESTQAKGDGGVSQNAELLDQSGSRVSAIAGAFDGIGGELGNFAGLTSDLGAAAKEALATGTSFQALAGAGVAAGVAAVGLAIALENFNQVTKESRVQLQGALTAQQSYYDAVATLDSESARERIASLTKELEARRALAVESRRIADSAYQQAVGQFGEAGAKILFATNGELQGLVTVADESAQEVAGLEQTLLRLNQGLTEGAFAANDAAIAQRQYTEALVASTAQSVSLAQKRLDLEDKTAAQLLETIDGNNDLIAINNTAIAALTELSASGDKVAEAALVSYTSRNLELLSINGLAAGLLGTAQARDTETEAAKAQEQAQKDLAVATQRSTAASERLAAFDATQATRAASEALQANRDLEDFNRRRLQETIDFNRQLAQADSEAAQNQLDLANELSEIAGESQNEQIEILQNAAKEQLNAAQKYQDDLAKIEKNARKDILSGAANLDALAVLNAQNARQEALDERAKQYEEEQTTAQENTEDALAELEKERNERLSAARQKLADERNDYAQSRAQRIAEFNDKRAQENNERAIAQARRNEDLALRQASDNAQRALLVASLNQEQALRQAAFAQANADLVNFFGGLLNQTARLSVSQNAISSGASAVNLSNLGGSINGGSGNAAGNLANVFGRSVPTGNTTNNLTVPITVTDSAGVGSAAIEATILATMNKVIARL